MAQAPNIFVALDHDDIGQAREMVRTLGTSCRGYKIGLTTLLTCGPGFVRELIDHGADVFLDVKLHEIPPSVRGAVTAAGQLGARMVSVHASAGSAALSAAVEAARSFPRLAVVALTVVTSLRDQDLQEIGIRDGVEHQVLRLARVAAAVGCDGVIASPAEAAALRAALPAAMSIVTPSIHLEGSAMGSSNRMATAVAAVLAGATHLVIGRAITAADDPAAAFARARQQIEDARTSAMHLRQQL